MSELLETTERVRVLYITLQSKLYLSQFIIMIVHRFVSWIGWKKMAIPLGERGYLGFARTSRRNTSTCAGRRGQVSARRDIAMPSAKPCCTRPVKTLIARASWSRSCVVPLEALQGIFTAVTHWYESNVPAWLTQWHICHHTPCINNGRLIFSLDVIQNTTWLQSMLLNYDWLRLWLTCWYYFMQCSSSYLKCTKHHTSGVAQEYRSCFYSVLYLNVSTVWLQQSSRTQTQGPAQAAQRARLATTELCPSLSTVFSVSFAQFQGLYRWSLQVRHISWDSVIHSVV